jgi:integrase
MSTITIATRKTKDGAPRYDVRYRLGGRAYPIQHGGTFKTMREARARRDLIGGELAAGRNPADVLRSALAAPAPHMTVTAWGEKYLASRIDVDSNTTKNYRTALQKAAETFGDCEPATITVDEVAAWVAGLAAKHKPGTVQLYLLTFRLLLDFASAEPNPARDPRVKLPKQTREEPNPPTADHVEAILAATGAKWRLLFVTIEQGALRLGEAVSLRWADVDAANLRLRLPRSATKRDRARWVYLPAWLIEAIEATCPLEDRAPERRVPRDHRGVGVPGDDARLPQREGAALPPARPPASPDHDLASERCPCTGACGTCGAFAAVDEPRRVLARDAAGRGCGRAGSIPARNVRHLNFLPVSETLSFLDSEVVIALLDVGRWRSNSRLAPHNRREGRHAADHHRLRGCRFGHARLMGRCGCGVRAGAARQGHTGDHLRQRHVHYCGSARGGCPRCRPARRSEGPRHPGQPQLQRPRCHHQHASFQWVDRRRRRSRAPEPNDHELYRRPLRGNGSGLLRSRAFAPGRRADRHHPRQPLGRRDRPGLATWQLMRERGGNGRPCARRAFVRGGTKTPSRNDDQLVPFTCPAWTTG